MPDPAAAIRALTYEHIERSDGKPVPLLDRSIANCLRDIERVIAKPGTTRLHAIAASIDEALLALMED